MCGEMLYCSQKKTVDRHRNTTWWTWTNLSSGNLIWSFQCKHAYRRKVSDYTRRDWDLTWAKTSTHIRAVTLHWWSLITNITKLTSLTALSVARQKVQASKFPTGHLSSLVDDCVCVFMIWTRAHVCAYSGVSHYFTLIFFICYHI